jgi:predicted small secreted protein
MPVRRLLVVVTLLASSVIAACSNGPTGVDETASTMQDSATVRKDQIPWH